MKYLFKRLLLGQYALFRLRFLIAQLTSKTCLDSVRKVFQRIDLMIKAGQLEKLSTDFKPDLRCQHILSVLASHGSGLQRYRTLPKDIYKIDIPDVYNNVQFSNNYYGGNNTKQSNIEFVNNSWHSLSILTNQTEAGIYSVFIPGTAHCADLRPQQDNDPIALTQAREQNYWLDNFLKKLTSKDFNKIVVFYNPLTL